MKNPLECENINDIRKAIDSIDEQVIALIGKRAGYVSAAAKFKKNKLAVKDTDRVKKMLVQRRKWAKEAAIDPLVIEKIFSILVDYFINQEIVKWEDSSS